MTSLPDDRLVLGVDGGNSKTDVAIANADGRLLALIGAGPTVSHQAVGIDEGIRRLAELVSAAREQAGLAARDRIELGSFCLAGADTPADLRLLRGALADLGLVERTLIRNDTQAALRSGTDRGWGVVVICGSGVNAHGVAPDGRHARLIALGEVSGDWGGGTDMGWSALAAAVRGRDGRGPRTSLERRVPAAFGLRRPDTLSRALYADRIDPARLSELSPLVFATAADGDPVAREIVDRLADEVVAMAGAMIRRLRLATTDVDVVLAGGVMATTFEPFHDRIRAGILELAPRARIVVPAAPPVLGAILIGLDSMVDRPVAARITAAAGLRRAWPTPAR
ncbi:MAG TPA: BadF/BadG/BcrA/BcrD ATPase family protein [Candidatus Limnocylindrales bacterium]